MPKYNHSTFGDIQSYVYLEGKILKVYIEDTSISQDKWDTADVEYENKKVFSGAKVRYHCLKEGSNRANGAIVDGAKGFDVGDQVIVMAKIGSSHGTGTEYETMFVVAHIEGPKRCTYNYLLVRISSSDFLPHTPPYGTWKQSVYTITDPGSLSEEYCTIWNTSKNSVATVINPTNNQPYVFPVTMEDLKPALDNFTFVDEELFTMSSQGDEESEEAGFVPDWLADGQGNLLRGSLPPDIWWNTYNEKGNPLLNLFNDAILKLMTDSEGLSSGTFNSVQDIIDSNNEKILNWKTLSPKSFGDDSREFSIKGSSSTNVISIDDQVKLQDLQEQLAKLDALIEPLKSSGVDRYNELKDKVVNGIELNDTAKQELVDLSNSPTIFLYNHYKSLQEQTTKDLEVITNATSWTSWATAHDKDMTDLTGKSYHLQMAYGEDEYWGCAKSTFHGMVVSYCDAMWKFTRLTQPLPVLGIDNNALMKLASGSAFMGGLAAGAMLSLGDIDKALASQAMVLPDNNMFSWGMLKRINEGCFHRTSNPAMKTLGIGSWRLTQNKIPNNEKETTFISALNTRYESIDIWSRYDNWMNTIACENGSWGVDTTWWMKSDAQQWKLKAVYIDTPLGNMFGSSPTWEVALWHMTGFNILFGGPTCRQDVPLNTHFVKQTKHSERLVSQVYIAQRQAVTLWDDPSRTFLRQELYKGAFDCFPSEDIKFVAKDPDNKVDDDYTLLSEEDKQNILSDKVYVRTKYKDEVNYQAPLPLRNNRNEIEIMASCDLYSTLQTNFGSYHPNNQVRNGDLEYEIEKLIRFYYISENIMPKGFSEFKLETRII